MLPEFEEMMLPEFDEMMLPEFDEMIPAPGLGFTIGETGLETIGFGPTGARTGASHTVRK